MGTKSIEAPSVFRDEDGLARLWSVGCKSLFVGDIVEKVSPPRQSYSIPNRHQAHTYVPVDRLHAGRSCVQFP